MLSLIKTWFAGKKSPLSSRPRRPSIRPTLEALEGRLVPSTLYVNNPSGSVYTPGSLPYEADLADVDAQRGQSDTVMFTNAVVGKTITLSTPVPLNSNQGFASVPWYSSVTPGTITIDGLSGTTITANRSSAFVIANGTTVQMNHVVVKNSGIPSEGGAVLNKGNLGMSFCQFDDNNAYYGGAIFNTGNLTMSNCYLIGNGAYKSGAAVYNQGTVNAYSCWFNYDIASGYGGAIYNDKTGLLYVLSTGNEFESDKALGGLGGGIYNSGYAVVNNAFFGNNSAYSGGAIADFGTIYVNTNITMDGNHADDFGGGIYIGPGSTYNFKFSQAGNTAGLQGPNYYIAGGKNG